MRARPRCKEAARLRPMERFSASDKGLSRQESRTRMRMARACCRSATISSTRVMRRTLRAAELLMGPAAPATWDEAELLEVPMTSRHGTADAELLGIAIAFESCSKKVVSGQKQNHHLGRGLELRPVFARAQLGDMPIDLLRVPRESRLAGGSRHGAAAPRGGALPVRSCARGRPLPRPCARPSRERCRARPWPRP